MNLYNCNQICTLYLGSAEKLIPSTRDQFDRRASRALGIHIKKLFSRSLTPSTRGSLFLHLAIYYFKIDPVFLSLFIGNRWVFGGYHLIPI